MEEQVMIIHPDDVLTHALKCMRIGKKAYKNYLSDEAIEAGKMVAELAEIADHDMQDRMFHVLRAEMPLDDPYPAIWWYSVLCDIKKDEKIFLELIHYIRKNQEAFSANTLYFLYYQLKRLVFVYTELNAPQIKESLWKLFIETIQTFEKQIEVSLEPIPYEKRNKNLVIVITEQFLRTEHGPTKTALDRCKTLIDKEGKTVLLINTTEILSMVGVIPFCGAVSGNYSEAMQQQEYWDWKGTRIPYIQCDHNMPDNESMNLLLTKIRELAPEYIISIGGSSVLSNLADNIIPVLTVGLNPAELEYTTTKYQTLSRQQTEADIAMLNHLGFEKEHVIEGVFTYSLKPQMTTMQRIEWGIPESSFFIIVVGARLDSEVTDTFLNMLEQTVSGNMFVGFAGSFDSYHEIIDSYPRLSTCSSCFGFVEDILAMMEIADLCVNPIRKGGGGSGVEAVYKGVPVVTTGYGDVSVLVGEDFWVDDYAQMGKKIQQYVEDHDYYEEMSLRARKRAEILLDSESEFIKIMNEVRRREQVLS